ncbi:MAG: ABC transporter permease [Burkholderiales bacterium]|nr:ABC transporter permease [Burkholderiales bacterium]
MIFLKLAWRNVLRNPRRSLLSILAIAIGLTALSFLWSFIEGVNDQMIENSTRYLAGHLQVHRSGYHDNQTLDRLMDDAGSVHAALAGKPGVHAVAERLEGMAILSVGEKSRGVMLIGVDPQQEIKVTTMHRSLIGGAYFSAPDASEVLLGKKTAESLRVGTGAEVVLLTQAADGSVGAGKYLVRGIFDTGMSMIDGMYVLMPLRAAQQLFVTGNGVTAVVARLEDRRAAAGLAQRLSQSLGRGFEVLAWQRLLPSVVQSTEFHNVVAYILLLVLFVVVAVGITNTILMAVMERYREFGIMMALGTRAGQVTRLIFYEAGILGFAGLLLGATVGVALIAYFGKAGIHLAQYAKAVETMQGLTGTVYPRFRLDRMLLLAAIVFFTAVVAALYPAWKAATLVPVDAIRGAQRRSADWLRRLQRLRWPIPRLPMGIFIKIATRCVLRNPRRAALTISATAFGLAAFVFLLSFVQGYLNQLVENSTGYVTGELQVQHERFRDDMALEYSLPAPAGMLELIRSHSAVAAAAPRVQAQVLISSPQQSQIVVLVGIDPAIEKEVTFIDRTVKQGRWLAGGAEKEVVIGRKLAGTLGIRLGEKLVVMAQAADGTFASGAFRLGGIYETESPSFDGAFAFVTLSNAQGLLGLGERISTVAVRLHERKLAAASAASLTSHLAMPAIAALPWQTLLPEIAQMFGYVRMNLRLIIGIVFSVIAVGVMNTLLMSVMERIREFGIMMALGTTPGEIVRIVVYEAIALTLIGLLTGFLTGAWVVGYFSVAGIDLSRYVAGLTTIPGLTGIIYPELAPRNVLLPAAALLLLSLVAALYPAWKAAQLDPAKALRHV